MASAIFIVNQRGEEVMCRYYKNDITKASMDTFRNKVIYCYIYKERERELGEKKDIV